MISYIQTNYPSLLSYSFFGCFFVLFVWEQCLTWIKLSYSQPLRWWNTISLSLLNRYFVFWLLPFTIIPVAIYAKSNSLGVLNAFTLNDSITLIIGFFLYDLCHYIQHWLLHVNAVLWRLHRVHHSDPDVDLSTEFKHHPLESLVTVIFLMAAVLTLGISPIAVMLRTLTAPITSLFSHANVKLPKRIDKCLRLVIITPTMHRVHHSSYQPETNSNYGTLFSFWDRLFKTYTEKPKLGYEGMQLGLESFRSERALWLDQLLLQPFRSAKQDAKQSVDSKNQL